jgi:hypothetical protein
MSHRHENLELCDALVRLADGSFSAVEVERLPKLPWKESYFRNAPADRMKVCPLCSANQPIANFLYEGPLRSITYASRHSPEFAMTEFVANVREWCSLCQRGGTLDVESV